MGPGGFQRSPHVPGKALVHLVDRLRLVTKDGADRGCRTLPLERPLAGGHLVKDDAQAEDVGPLIDRLALGLLRRHVGRGSDHPAFSGHVHISGGQLFILLQQLGQSEVEDLGPPFLVEHDVAGLQIAVQHAMLVRIAHRADQGNRDVQDLAQGEPVRG
jgi:hypothetical protein